MPYIRVIDEHEADGALREIYQELRGSRGKLAAIHTIHSLSPQALRAHMDLYMTLMFGRSKLKRDVREAIAVLVSRANGCDYCDQHHGQALLAHWKDPERLAALRRDPREADLDERTLAILDHAVALTRTPQDASETDVRRLREQGVTDEEILDLTLITGYFNFVNRIALGLGVEATKAEASGYRY
ncbi:MAG: peroxidase-related enzyme [Trueperaceae bacterium]